MVSPIKKVSSSSVKRSMINKGASKSAVLKRIGSKKTVHVYSRKDGAIRTKKGRFALYSRSLDKKRHGKAYSKKHPIGKGRYKHTRDGTKRTGKQDVITSLVRPLGSVTNHIMKQKRKR